MAAATKHSSAPIGKAASPPPACTHPIKPGCRISRFWSLAPVRDLLFRAEHLLFEANHTSDRARTGRAWGQAQKFELLIARGAAPGTLVPVLSCLWEFGTDRPALHRRNTSGASPTRRDGRMGVKCPGPIAGTGLTGRVFAIAFAELFCGLARKRSSRF
jgi:hypothetical protein